MFSPFSRVPSVSLGFLVPITVLVSSISLLVRLGFRFRFLECICHFRSVLTRRRKLRSNCVAPSVTSRSCFSINYAKREVRILCDKAKEILMEESNVQMAELAAEKHVRYILSVEKRKDNFESVVMEHLRMSGAYWGLTALDLLGKLGSVDVDEVTSWLLSCQHESVFCCVGALAITGSLDLVDKDLLGWWLCERQVKSGGLNGRPEKLPDVCYSWWVLSSLTMIDRVHWISKEKLIRFILDCQDTENGGISDRPDDAVDVFHTFFGVAGRVPLIFLLVFYSICCAKSCHLGFPCLIWEPPHLFLSHALRLPDLGKVLACHFIHRPFPRSDDKPFFQSFVVNFCC
ncbi:uncharacterized protein LOC108331811 isoform X8 [Vigna angularis]|uniref:uncharacterized protein LOC108331811 isoform X8 n=1 Tax=Phaseolus angularis TaxID=3914 RepID=UPI0022B5028E|nr:uncharacterized protein LOC108331811 isoform X8 [Vigna angularis]